MRASHDDAMNNRPAVDPFVPKLDGRIVALIVGAKLLVHLATCDRYGYFRDELYFLDCARNLAWGYADHAPLIAVYGKVALLLGGSLPVLRGIAGLAGAGLVMLAIVLARELGGGRFAQALAGLTVLAAPMNLAIASLFTMNVFEPLYWMGAVLVLVRIVKTQDSRLWLWWGLLVGLGLMNKHSTVFFGFSVVVALALSPERREFLRPWVWLGGTVALLIFLPNVIWQVTHDWPTLEMLDRARTTGRNVVLGPAAFVGQQVLAFHPLLLPVWLTGLAALLFGRLKQFRVLGIAFAVFFAVMLAMKAKVYYLAPVYPLLFAAGAVAIEGHLERWRWARGRLLPRALLVGLVVLVFATSAPAMLPILAPAQLIAYQEALGVRAGKTEVRHVGPLEQRFGDQFGWEELVAEVAAIYDALPVEQRARTGIFASNYGEAGALNLFGPKYGLPPSICAHLSHYFWGPKDFQGDTLIWLQWSREGIAHHCQTVEEVGRHSHPWGMAEENRSIYICRGLKKPLSELWPTLKHYD